MKHMEMEEYKRHDEAYGDGWDMKNVDEYGRHDEDI